MQHGHYNTFICKCEFVFLLCFMFYLYFTFLSFASVKGRSELCWTNLTKLENIFWWVRGRSGMNAIFLKTLILKLIGKMEYKILFLCVQSDLTIFSGTINNLTLSKWAKKKALRGLSDSFGPILGGNSFFTFYFPCKGILAPNITEMSF